MKVKLTDVTKSIFAGGDVPKNRFSESETDKYKIPIYANAEKDNGLYGYTDIARVSVPCVTVAARGTIGFTVKRMESFLPVVRLITVIPDEEKITLDYLYYALRNCRPKSSGTSIPQLTVPDIKKYSFEITSILKQKEVTQTLDKIERLIEMKRKQIGNYDSLINSLFVEMFGDPVSNTLGWNTVKVGDICFVTKLAGFEYTEYINYQDHGDVIMIRGLNVKEKKLKLDDIYYIDAAVSDMLPRSQLKANDIVMTYVGVNIGDVALVDGYNRYHLAPNVAKISLNSYEMLNPVFFVNLLAFNKENYASNATNTAKQALNMEKIRKLQVMLPPITLQNQFADFVEQVEKTKVAVQKSLTETQLLFDSLMQQYFG